MIAFKKSKRRKYKFFTEFFFMWRARAECERARARVFKNVSLSGNPLTFRHWAESSERARVSVSSARLCLQVLPLNRYLEGKNRVKFGSTRVKPGFQIPTRVTTQKWKWPVYDDSGCPWPAFFYLGHSPIHRWAIWISILCLLACCSCNTIWPPSIPLLPENHLIWEAMCIFINRTRRLRHGFS